jgi:hypothetical protein
MQSLLVKGEAPASVQCGALRALGAVLGSIAAVPPSDAKIFNECARSSSSMTATPRCPNPDHASCRAAAEHLPVAFRCDFFSGMHAEVLQQCTQAGKRHKPPSMSSTRAASRFAPWLIWVHGSLAAWH